MLEVVEQLKEVRPIRAYALRSRVDAWLVKGALCVGGLAIVQIFLVIGLLKIQQYGILPFDLWEIINKFASWTYGFLVFAVVYLFSLLIVGLCCVKKSAHGALLVEAKHDQAQVEKNLLSFDRSDLLATKAFLGSKVADIQNLVAVFYSGGAVFLLTLATAAWSVSKDLLGEEKLRKLTSVHIADAAPVIFALVIGMMIIIAVFKPLKSIYGYHLRLIEITLALQERAKVPVVHHPRQCWWCRFRQGVLGCTCDKTI